MSNVVDITGKTLVKETGRGQSVKDTLIKVETRNMSDILVIGYDQDGELRITSSVMTNECAVYMLEQAKFEIMHGANDEE